MISKKLRYKIEYFFVICTGSICRTLPRRFAYILSDALCSMSMLTLRSRWKTGMDNLDHVYGDELGNDEKRRIIKGSFRNLSDVFTEFLIIPSLTDDAIKEMVTSQDGLEHLDAALKAGNGAIIVSAHTGNWELLAAYLGISGYNLNVIYREQNNRYMDKLIYKTRSRWDINLMQKTIVKKVRLKEREVMFRDESFNSKVLSKLRGNGIVFIMMDQNPYPAGIEVEFMRRRAYTTASPAVYSKRALSPVIPAYCIREGRGRYRLVFEPPVATMKDNKETVKEINASMEKAIRNHPEQWLWIHNRWRF